MAGRGIEYRTAAAVFKTCIENLFDDCPHSLLPVTLGVGVGMAYTVDLVCPVLRAAAKRDKHLVYIAKEMQLMSHAVAFLSHNDVCTKLPRVEFLDRTALTRLGFDVDHERCEFTLFVLSYFGLTKNKMAGTVFSAMFKSMTADGLFKMTELLGLRPEDMRDELMSCSLEFAVHIAAAYLHFSGDRDIIKDMLGCFLTRRYDDHTNQLIAAFADMVDLTDDELVSCLKKKSSIATQLGMSIFRAR